MATRTREANALLFYDRADAPNRNAVEAFPVKQVSRIVSAILAMVRDSVLDLCLLAGHYSRVTVELGQDDRRRIFRGTA